MTKQNSNHYYARREERRINPDTGIEEVYLEVPILVETETEVVFGKKTQPVKIGGVHMNCYYDWIPEGYYITHKRNLEAEAKREERSFRCLIADGKGGRIMCPESNKCSECKKCNSFKFDNGHNTSLDALQECGFDITLEEGPHEVADVAATPEDTIIGDEEDVIWGMISEDVITRLAAIKPKYGVIFQELLKGVVRPSDIARNTGLKANRTCEDLPKVRSLAAEIFITIKKEYDL